MTWLRFYSRTIQYLALPSVLDRIWFLLMRRLVRLSSWSWPSHGILILNGAMLKRRKNKLLLLPISLKSLKFLFFQLRCPCGDQVLKANHARLKSFSYRFCDVPKATTKSLINNCSRAALLCSFSIFMSRNEPSWTSPAPLIVRWCPLIVYSWFI